MSKIINFGETVEGYNLPVLNEREIRASAGILFLLIYTALMLIIFKENFVLIKISITMFLVDFIIRVFINPRFSPTLIIGRLIVGRQTPEYVSAAPKKFAWIIGISLAVIMFVLMTVMNTYSAITGLICLICMIFLFFESVFGICLGCLFYPLFFKKEKQLCPGDICEVKVKHQIQKVTWVQVALVLSFITFIVLTAIFFSHTFSVKPTSLF